MVLLLNLKLLIIFFRKYEFSFANITMQKITKTNVNFSKNYIEVTKFHRKITKNYTKIIEGMLKLR